MTLEMEMAELHDDWSLWEPALGLPEVAWTDGLLDNCHADVGRDSLLEGDFVWKDDWLDERIDVGAFMSDIDAVLNDASNLGDFLQDMDLPDQSSAALNDEEISIEKNLTEDEPATEVEVEIETNEVTFDETAVIYLNPCEVSSPSVEHYATSDSNELHFVVSPSISETVYSDEIESDRVSPVFELNSVFTFAGQTVDGKSETTDDSLTAQTSSDHGSLKSKSGRRKSRVEPYRNTWEGSNSSSCSSSSFSDSSNPVSPLSTDSQEHPPRGKRKERKKCQNRTAATKYRQKKRAESEAIGTEERSLEEKNKELKEKANQLSSEIGYLKGLMREILIAKGLINK